MTVPKARLGRRHFDDDDDVYYYIRWRLKLEGETENMGVCTKERKGITAAVLMATPCTNSLGGESGGQKHEGREGRSACWKYAAVSDSLHHPCERSVSMRPRGSCTGSRTATATPAGAARCAPTA